MNKNRLRQYRYTLQGKASQYKKDGQLLPENQLYALYSPIMDCANFKQDKSVTEVLLDGLTYKSRSNHSSKLLVTSKYYCELVFEGIKYAWGMMKDFFQNLALKSTKNNFNKVDTDVVRYVSKDNAEKFLAR